MVNDKIHAAFADFDRIHQLIERAAARIIRTLDLPPWLEFDDLMQEGFLMACEAAHRWDPQRARFTTYLYLHLDFFLRRAIQRRLPARWERSFSDEDEDQLESEQDSLEEVEIQHTVHSLLGRLRDEAPLAFEVLTRFYGVGNQTARSLRTIERDLGLRRGEGEQWLREGLLRLRNMWMEDLAWQSPGEARERMEQGSMVSRGEGKIPRSRDGRCLLSL